MLIHQIPYRNNFVNGLNNIGYPENLRKVAIANGAGNSYSQRKNNGTVFNPKNQIIEWEYENFYTVSITGNSWAVSDQETSSRVFKGEIDYTWLAHIGLWDFNNDKSKSVYANYTLPYDNAPRRNKKFNAGDC